MSDQGEIKRLPKKVAPEGASKATRDCLQECSDKYDTCWANAGTSTAAQAACNVAYSKCVGNC